MTDKPKTDDKPEVQKIEMGGSGTAKVAFKDSFGSEVKAKSVEWSSDSPSVVVTADDKDPLSAKLFAPAAGPARITAVGTGEEGGTATTSIDVVVLPKASAATGEITLSVQAAPAKKKAEPAPAPAHAQTQTHATAPAR
jgi:uncharacterized protein YjdB